MTDASSPSPEHTVARDDPGDETARRYRYQWTWAALACCALLDETEDVQEVFCEHHEDVLLKHRDGAFTGHQVKTRDDDQPPWRANDKAVVTACARFTKLDSEYPGRFRRFCFLTNHPLHSADNGHSLPYLLGSIREAAAVGDLPPVVAKWVQRIAREASVTPEVAFGALSKTVATADLPKLRDAVMRLIDAIVQCWAPAAEGRHATVTAVAQALIDECGRASSLDHDQLLPGYVVATKDVVAELAARIEGKRMTLARVQRILEQGCDSVATLSGDAAGYAQPGDGSTELLHRKLDAGGFGMVSRNSADDLRDKADYLGIVWTKKYGHNQGLRRYEHIRSVVLADAGRAYDATQTQADGFGPAMREDLRRRLHERRTSGDQLFDATDDHLEGVAFSLTAQCKVVWSLARPWESS